MIADDATIERLRSKIESHALSPKELTEALILLEFWYEEQLAKIQNPRKKKSPK